MIGLGDIYKVVEANVPLCIALILGYGSVRWWRVFTSEQCEVISRFVALFTLPLFAFEFTIQIDPFTMNYRFVAADILSKVVIFGFLGLWATCISHREIYCWGITTFSLSTSTNSLVVGLPFLNAMYRKWSQDLVVQSSVIQAVIWMTLLLFVLELRKAITNVEATEGRVNDLEANSEEVMVIARPSFWTLIKLVWIKLAVNPNFSTSIFGLIWAIIANRWHIRMPEIVEESILILSRAGSGTAMFSMGLSMALQDRMIACGMRLTAYGMLLRFIAGPAAMAIGAIVVGLHGDILRVVIIQAALPQSVTSFIFAREYGLHADVLSTAQGDIWNACFSASARHILYIVGVHWLIVVPGRNAAMTFILLDG